jgi:hypothetical protein
VASEAEKGNSGNEVSSLLPTGRGCCTVTFSRKCKFF